MSTDLADRWRAARPPVAGIHLDSAACSRQSYAVIDAAARHARHEAEVGGYVAAEAAAPVLEAGRTAVAALTGVAADDVVFTTGATDALDLLLADWRGERTVACLPGEYGPNLAVLARHGFEVHRLPVDPTGRLDVDALDGFLKDGPPALVHLTMLGSHRGTVQPAGPLGTACRAAGIPLVVDAAQAFSHLDCATIGADAIYTSSRKWTAGPRGVGVLATRPGFLSDEGLALVAHREVNLAAHVALSLALGEHLAAGPALIQERLVEVGAMTRSVLAGVAGWRVVEAAEEPSAITTSTPPDGVDARQVRERLIADHRIVTTYVGVERAPGEMTTPALRVSPHVDVTPDDLESLARALTEMGV